MKSSQLVRAIVFLVVFCIILIGLSYIMRDGSVVKPMSGYLSLPENSVDVVFVGGSTSQYMWISEKLWKDLGITSYVAYFSSATRIPYKQWIIELEKSQSPKLYVIDLYTYYRNGLEKDYDEIRIRRVTDGMPYSLNRLSAIMAYDIDEFLHVDRMSLIFDISKYHENYNNLSMAAAWQQLFWHTETPFGTFFSSGEYRPQEPILTTETTRVEELDLQAEKVLLDLIEFVKEKNLNVLYILPPSDNTEFRRALSKDLSEILKEHGQNLLYMNQFADEIGLDYTKDFENGTHINFFGAQKATSWFETWLIENLSWSDKRGDPLYHQWDEGYEKYLEACETVQLIRAKE